MNINNSVKNRLKILSLFTSVVLSLLILSTEITYGAVSKNWATSGNFSLFNSGLEGQDVGVTQGQVAGEHALEITTSDSDGDQATRLVLKGNNDDADIIFYSGGRSSERVLFTLNDNGNLVWSEGGTLRNDQGGSLELGSKGTPYLDFSNDVTSDYDARFILLGNDTLQLRGSELETTNSEPLTSGNTANDSSVSLGWENNLARIRVGGNGTGAKNGLSVQQVGNAEIFRFDEVGGRAEITSDFGSICIGNC